MSWAHFDGTARTLQESINYLSTLKWTDWKPQGVTLHNTAMPTLAMWPELGKAHDDRIKSLQRYYEQDLGWHQGPHWFISRTRINWFSNPLLPGTHSRCFNATRFGIEMVGDFAKEPFDSGDGAMVRDLALAWVAALNNRFGFKADALTFHKECTRDNHDCPGKLVHKPDVILRIAGFMAGAAPAIVTPTAPTVPAPRPVVPSNVLFETHGKMSVFGGPKDTGMRHDEGLALFASPQQMVQHGLADYLLSAAQAGASGMGRRLNPEKYYIACRWPAALYTQLRDLIAAVSNPKTGETLMARPVDWGPNERTGRVADLSPGLARALKLDTDDVCHVVVTG